MAGQKSNVIEYVFQGNTLDLQQAIKKVDSLLRSSAKGLKKYQDGALNATQEAQLKKTRKLLKQMREIAGLKGEPTSKQARAARAAGKEALRQAQRMAEQTAKVEARARKQEAAKQQRISNLTSVAGQENARQHASFLSSYADRLRAYLSTDAYSEIKNAVAAYNTALEENKKGLGTSEERTVKLASATENLQKVYKSYSETLQTAVRAYQANQKGVKSLGDLLSKFKDRINDLVNSVEFWVHILLKVVELLKQGVKNAADYVESMNYLNAVTDEANASLTEFIELQRQAFGLSPTVLNQTTAAFFSFGDSLGWTTEQAALLAETMTKLTNDLSSLHNVEADVAATKLRSALAGNTRAMQAWGISVHDASIEEWLASKGIQASMRSMNEASQAAARYAFILEKTTSAHGDLAKTLKSPANQMRILNTQIQLLLQNLGALIVPVLTPLLNIVNGILQPVNALLMAMTALSSASMTASVGDQADALEDLADSSDEAAAGLTSLDEINQASKKDTTTGISDEIAALMKGYDNLAEKTQPLIDLFTQLGETLAPVFDLVTRLPFDALTSTLETLAPVLDMLLVPIEAILEGLSWLLSSIVNPVMSWVQALTSDVWNLVAAFLALNAIQLIVTGDFKSLMAVKLLDWLTDVTIALWENVKALVASAAAALKSAAASIAEGVAAWWAASAWWQKALAVIAAAGALALVVGGIVAAATAPVSAQADASMNKQSSPPALAHGGVVSGPTFALVGEGQYSEAVVPLGNSPQFQAMKQEIAAETARNITRTPYGTSAGRADGAGSKVLVLQVNGREFARGVLPDMQYVQQQTGVRFK